MKIIYQKFRKISLITLVILLLFSGCTSSKKQMIAYLYAPTEQKLYLNLSEEDTDEIKGIIDLFTSNNKETYPITGGIPFYVEYDNLTYMISASIISIKENNEWKTYEAKITNEEAIDYTLSIVKICQKTYPGMLLNVMADFGKTTVLKTEERTISGDDREGSALIMELYACLYDAYQHPVDSVDANHWQMELVLTDLAGDHILFLKDNQIKIGEDIYSSDFSGIIQTISGWTGTGN